MASTQQSRDFGWEFFDDIVDWVGDNLSPHDVFDEKDLETFCKEWAKDNNFVEDIYDED